VGGSGALAEAFTDIAARVGYSELSAFSHASRRWFGVNARSFVLIRLISTTQLEQRLGIFENLRVIEGKLDAPPIIDPFGGGGV
jgi:hypothetical protein